MHLFFTFILLLLFLLHVVSLLENCLLFLVALIVCYLFLITGGSRLSQIFWEHEKSVRRFIFLLKCEWKMTLPAMAGDFPCKNVRLGPNSLKICLNYKENNKHLKHLDTKEKNGARWDSNPCLSQSRWAPYHLNHWHLAFPQCSHLIAYWIRYIYDL